MAKQKEKVKRKTALRPRAYTFPLSPLSFSLHLPSDTTLQNSLNPRRSNALEPTTSFRGELKPGGIAHEKDIDYRCVRADVYSSKRSRIRGAGQRGRSIADYGTGKPSNTAVLD